MFNPMKESKIGIQMSTTISELFLYTLKNSGLIENEALYNLKLEVVEDTEKEFFPDQAIH